MPDIQIRIQNKKATLKLPKVDAVVCCNSNYSLVFDFDAEWNAYEWKTVRCVSDGYHGRVVEVNVGPTNRCELPEVMGGTFLDIGVYADNGAIASTPLQLTCEKSILCER